MKTVTYFATCNGETVTLSKVGYMRASDIAKTRDITQTEPPANQSKHVRLCVASGGGRPAVFDHAIGQCSKCNRWHFAERMIERPSNASNHVCNGRCMAATGKVCECSCRGKNHGAGSNFSISI